MRMIRLVLQRNEYIAGEVVSGTLVVKCDKKFRCERADIVLSGTFEQVQMVRKGVIESRYISPRSPTRPKVAGFRIYCIFNWFCWI